MAKKIILPEPIAAWHEHVKAHPKDFGRDVRKLIKLVSRLLRQKDIFYDPTDVDAFFEFCSLGRHREGRWAGAPFECSIEQRYFAACVFGIKTFDPELKMDVRYFREAVLLVARKWGKSTFLSAVAIFMLICDREPAAQVWCLATQKQQASIVYEAAKNFALSSPEIAPFVKTRRDKDNSEILLFPLGNSYMKAGSKNSNAQDGLNPHCYIIDEMHAIENRNTYDVFSSATGARAQALGVIISTFGFVREGIFDSVLDRCESVLNGKSKERLFPMIFRIDTEDDPANEACWIKANPGLPEARPTMSYLRGEREKALKDPAQMPSFQAKHLNRASAQSIVYFDLHVIDKCAIDMSDDVLRGRYAVGGYDLAETTDLCNATAVVPIGGKMHVFQKYFIARQRLEFNSRNDKMAYESFCTTGAADPLNHELLHICEGSMVNRKDVAQWYAHIRDTYDVIFWKIGGDRWHFADFAQDMAEVGFSTESPDGRGILFPVAMGAKSLSQPIAETRALFEDQGVRFSRHNGLFRWCVTNVAVRLDVNNNIQPDKKASRSRIDGYMGFLCSYVAYKKCENEFAEFQP